MQPTSPTLSVDTLDRAIEYALDNNLDTLISAINAPHLSWGVKDGKKIPNYEERLNRQYLPPCYMETGAFVISKASVVTSETRIGEKVDVFEIPENEAQDVDTFSDLRNVMAELDKQKVAIYVNGNNKRGIGHIYRALELADEFYVKPDIYYDANQTEPEVFGKTTHSLIPVNGIAELFDICRKKEYTIFINDILNAGYKEETVEIHYEKYIVLWLQVFIYSVVLTIVIQCISGTMELKALLKAFMPVTATQYWYFTAYTPVFFLAPWLKKFVHQLSTREAKLCLVILGIFGVYSTLAGILYDPFRLEGGYSFIWLTVLFLVGALIKKIGILNYISTKKAWTMVGVSVLLNWFQKLIIPSQNIFTSYISITMVILSVALLGIFSGIDIKSYWVQKLIKTMASATFGVYLIRTSTERPEALDKGCFVLAGIDSNSLVQAVETAVAMNENGDYGIPVPDYVEENVSTKVVKIIQSYTGVVNKMVWRKF